MTAKGRVTESNIEDIRKDAMRNINQISGSSDARKFGRIVDRDAVTKCRLRTFAQWNRGLNKLHSSENGSNYEKHRRHYGNGYHLGEIPLGTSIESLYFEKYGEGFDGTDVPARIGEHYVCWKCGLKYDMGAVSLPLECHRCKTETPLGRLVRDGWYRR